jgi:hypothetical protein
MSGIEIYLCVACGFLAIGSFIITLWYRDLQRKFDEKVILLDSMESDIDHLTKKLANLLSENMELQKKHKLSGDVLAVLNDMKQGGAVFEVTRIDRNDIFLHNGSQFR